MRLAVALLTATLLTDSLVGCASGYGVPQSSSLGSAQMRFTTGRSPTANVVPVELRSSSILTKIRAAARRDQTDAVTPGIYAAVGGASVGSYTYVYGYSNPDSSNGPPVCKIGPYVNPLPLSIAVDRNGDLLVTKEYGTVTILKGPGLCGPELGSVAVPSGATYDVASLDARSGKIVLATGIVAGGKDGGVTVCTLSGGCTAPLLIPHVRVVDAVAIAPNGDCWGLGKGKGTRHAADILGYFAHCRGRGVPATRFEENDVTGRLDIDANGNLVSTNSSATQTDLYIYSGCNPACKLVGGPFQLRNFGVFERLDASSKHFVAGESAQLDIYSYSTTGISYEYSISNGSLCCDLFSAALSPPSKE